MSRHSLRNLFAVVAIGAGALGATFAPNVALAFGHGVGSFGGGHFGSGHFGGGHFGGGHFGGGHFGGGHFGGGHGWIHPVFGHHPHPVFGHHPHWHPVWWHHHHHHWPHPIGFGGGYTVVDNVGGGPVSAPAPVPAAAPAPAPAACAAPVADGTYLRIVFVPTATAADITGFLQDLQADMSEGPDKDGVYLIKVSEGKLSPGDLNQLIASIKSQTKVVSSVEAAG